jgi:transcriptional regulator with XRE-family HTH domain
MHKKKEQRAHEQADGILLLFMNFRKLNGLSQEEMASILGINRSYLGQIEQGKRPITNKLQDRFVSLQNDLAEKNPAPLLEEKFENDNHVGDELRVKWAARFDYLKYKLHNLQREIGRVPNGKLHAIKIENLHHLVNNLSKPEPVKNLIREKHKTLCRTTPLQLQQLKLELEFEAELLTLEMGLIEKYLDMPVQNE